MKYLVVYDVSEDKLRTNIRNVLKDSGGERIQYSAFLIELTETELHELVATIKNIVGTKKAKIVFIPLCKRDLNRVITLIHNYYLPPEEEPVIL